MTKSKKTIVKLKKITSTLENKDPLPKYLPLNLINLEKNNLLIFLVVLNNKISLFQKCIDYCSKSH